MRRRKTMLVFGTMAMALAAAAVGIAQVSPDRSTYLAALSDPPLAARAAAGTHGLGMTPQEEKRAVRVAMASADGEAYLRRLDAARANVLDLASRNVGRALAPRQVYRHAANGMALELSADEAQRIAGLPGVATVRRERVLHVHTDAGPQWIGANTIWSGAAGGIAATKGEGVVIGVIDTGINPTHPSFAAHGGDGYTATNPRGHFYGLCATAQAQCNAKLIGIYDFTNEGTQGVDSVGHGSHTSGIAAGNAIADALNGYTVALSRNVSGVAPHANLIMYKGCNSKPIDASSDGTCAESALVGAIDQAVADQVDVINYSIGGGTFDPYELLADPTSDAHAMFLARAAGVVIAVSAGNDGPGPNSLDEPGNSPWVIGAANASHNRRFVNSIGAFTGAPNAPATLNGQGYTSGYGPAAIVYAGNYGNALCGIGDTQGVTPTGASNPFPAGTFHGEIVICDRGTYARVEKGYNVKAAGAGGYILANAQGDGESIISDDHYLPAVHLGYSEGQALKAWVATAGTHSGTIAGVSAVLDAAFGDILDASSSRGPYGFGGVLKPDITAPGDNILSAAQTGTGLALLSGTSMASPHVAGSAALVLAVHPDWSPAQVESTLMGTALADVRTQDGVTPASPLDAGAGRVQPAAAVQAGVYLPLNTTDFFAGSGSINNPTAHGDLSKLNRIGLENEACFQHCNFSRVVTDISGGGTWQISSTATTGAAITVTPNVFSLGAGASQPLNIAVDVTDPRLPGNWVNGRIVLHKTSGKAATDVALTLAVYASPGAKPAFQQIMANAPGGSTTIQLSGLVSLPQATFTTASLVQATPTQVSLGVDPKPDDIYGTFPGSGKQFVLFPNVYTQGVDTASYGRIFVVEVTASNAVQTNLFAGIDSNGDGQPNANEQRCQSLATNASGVTARCVVDLRGAGPVNVWALVEIPTGTSGVTYSVTLSSGIPSVNVLVPEGLVAQQLHVVGPGHIPAAASFPLRMYWDDASDSQASAPIVPGKYYGVVMIDGVSGLAPNALGQSAFVPLSFTRNGGGNDVADALEPDAARTLILEAGETLQHMFVDLPANATSLTVATSEDAAGGSAKPLTFYVLPADYPAPSTSPQIAPAPTPPPGTMPWNLGGSVNQKSVTIPVGGGRWYVVAVNAGTGEATFSLSTQVALSATAAPALTPGNYFNPQRSGHGIFLSQGGGQQVVDWYTFLEDGTPVWYVALNAAPAAGVGTWNAPLYRATWDGSSGSPTQVGDVILTATSNDHAMFSWHLFGQSGSEAFELIAQPTCVDAGGSVNLNGEWFPPAQAGYGFDALVLPGQQFDAFYMYDGIGDPVWTVGANGPFVATSTIPMLQSTGFCPICAYHALTTQAAGSMTVTYTNGSSGMLSTAITLNAPLSGTWNVSQPIARLTGSETCSQYFQAGTSR